MNPPDIAPSVVDIDTWVQLTSQLYNLCDTVLTAEQRDEHSALLGMAHVSIMLYERNRTGQ